MASTDFAHLHLHTQYSFLDGAIRLKDLISKTKELGMTSVAVTDHGNMFGALDFYQQARAAGIKPILGMEAYVTGIAGDNKHTDKEKRENFHLVLLAENNTGYDNLKKLSTRAFTHGKYYYPRIDRDLLKQHSEGLIALTACLGGEVGKKAAKGDRDGARDAARVFKDIFGPDHFFLEVQPNGIPKQNEVNAFLAEMGKSEGIQLTATNDCHYVTRDQHEAQNILMAIRQQLPWGDPKLHKHETDAFYIRSGEEMWNLLKTDHATAFEQSCEIARRCKVELSLGKPFLPPFPIPSDYPDEAGFLSELSYKGLERRFTEIAYKVDREEYKARLQTELNCIIKMGFPGYFLIVQDFINWSKENLVRVGPGRGSGAGSLVAYALRITDLDPLPYDLLFERFLNPERVSMPDFDVDFMQEGRGKVIDYVVNKYGRERVGQIATYSGMNPKSAIKDVARTLGISFTEINELTKPIPPIFEGKKLDFETALTYAPALTKLADTDPKYKKVIDVARTLEGLFRQAGMHAGGVVIGEKDLVEYVPCFSGNNGEYVTQFDKDKVELAGLVKFDFLGLKTLDVIESCERLINTRIERENLLSGVKPAGDGALSDRQLAALKHPHALRVPDRKDGDPMPPLIVDVLHLDEDKVYKLIASGDTLGVFQVESSGMRDMCRRLKPTCFEDVVAGVALYRPGPMDAGMLDEFIERKHGRRKVTYPHPLLQPVLQPTYGTIVYQEQVMQCAQVLAGYSLGGADLLRRAMGKKAQYEMDKQRAVFAAGCEKNGIPPQQAKEIFDTIDKFAGYGFNKSHSAAYALITYQTAYLKCFYPIEFMAALLTTEVSSTENVVKYIQEARSHGIEVLPPDVNVSEISFSVDYAVDDALRLRRKMKGTSYGRIRFGLSAVKGMGDAALEAVLETRRRVGRFTSLYHFLEALPAGKVNRKVLEVLIKSGSLDSLNKPRNTLFSSIDDALSVADANRADAASAQFSLFGAATTKRAEVYKDVVEWAHKEKLQNEREAVGFYLSGHPLDRYVDDARKLGAVPTAELVTLRHNSEVAVTGIVAALKERKMKTGDGRWAVVTIEDTFGQAEVLCFSKVYEVAEALLKEGEPVLVRGKVLIDDVDDDGKQLMPKMRAESVQSLAQAQIQRTRFLDVTIEAKALDPTKKVLPSLSPKPEDDVVDDAVLMALEKISSTCQSFKGAVPARFKLEMPAGYVVVVHSGEGCRVTPSEELVAALQRVKGVVSVVRS
ncbi:MAG: DNA polymerase III subunit alpha [Deltaproteobacteria bacterium]|nr:DNA polymerase III subunit alpha [Deltaproteobacteria bacterium]